MVNVAILKRFEFRLHVEGVFSFPDSRKYDIHNAVMFTDGLPPPPPPNRN